MQDFDMIDTVAFNLFPEAGHSVANVKFFADAPVTAAELAADLAYAEAQIADGRAVLVEDVDHYRPRAA